MHPCLAEIWKKRHTALLPMQKQICFGRRKTQRITIEIPAERLTSYDENKAAWVLEEGFYGIFVGNSLKSARLLGGLELNQTVETEKVKNLFAGERPQEVKEQQADATNEREKSLKKDAVEKQLPILELSSSDFVTKEVVYKENRELADEEAMQFVNTLSVEELIDLAAGDPAKPRR